MAQQPDSALVELALGGDADGFTELCRRYYPALVAIYRATGGYPRKIINLCHQCILAMIIQNKRKVAQEITGARDYSEENVMSDIMERFAQMVQEGKLNELKI